MFNCQLCSLQMRRVKKEISAGYRLTRICDYCLGRICHSDQLPSMGNVFETGQGTHPLITAFVYQDLPQALIHNFKYRRQIIHGKILLDHLTEKLITHYSMNPWPDIITNIPQTEARYFQRGFCHTTILAQWLSKAMAIPFIPLLKRQGDPKQQAGLNKQQRILNVQKSFSIDQRERIPKHTRIALIDDVITTGATTNEALKTLCTLNEIVSTDVWCLARVPTY